MSGTGEITTPFLGLIKPPIGADDDVWGDRLNTNSDTIDTNASSHDARIAALEAAMATLQANVAQYQEQVGTVKWWPTFPIPTGWLNLAGQAVATATYPDLFALWGYAFGGSGANFNLLDMRGRVPVGLDQGTNILQGQYGPDTPGQRGGAATITLTTGQMPPHQHGGGTDAQGQHAHQFDALQAGDGTGTGQWAPASVELTGNTYPAGIHAHNVTTDIQGGGQPHSNAQPGTLGYWIVKAVKL